MKYILALLLSIPFLANAVPVAETVGPKGKLVLEDSPCTLVPLGMHFQAYETNGQKAFFGCWIMEDKVVYLMDNEGRQLQLDPSAFTWFKSV